MLSAKSFTYTVNLFATFGVDVGTVVVSPITGNKPVPLKTSLITAACSVESCLKTAGVAAVAIEGKASVYSNTCLKTSSSSVWTIANQIYYLSRFIILAPLYYYKEWHTSSSIFKMLGARGTIIFS